MYHDDEQWQEYSKNHFHELPREARERLLNRELVILSLRDEILRLIDDRDIERDRRREREADIVALRDEVWSLKTTLEWPRELTNR